VRVHKLGFGSRNSHNLGTALNNEGGLMNETGRDRRWGQSVKAMGGMLFFAFLTIIGYIDYEVILANHVGPQLLTVNTFFWLLFYNLFDPNHRKTPWTWRSLISEYIVKYTIGTFTYWYAFWLGLSLAGTPLALAVLALVMIVTPLAVRNLEAKENRASGARIILLGCALIVTVLLIKIDLYPEQLTDFGLIGSKLKGIIGFPLVCMLIAVAAEGYSDRAVYALPKHIHEHEAAFRLEYSTLLANAEPALRKLSPAEKARKELDLIQRQAGAEIIRMSWKPAIILALVMMALHGTKALPTGSNGWLNWLGLFFGMALLGFTGSRAKPWILTPMQGRGLDAESVPPIMAGRQIIFYGLAWLLVNGLLLLQGRHLECSGLQKDLTCSAFGVLPLHLGIVPQSYPSYWLGVFIAVSIWIGAWARYCKIGFFTRQQG
jgi:hypothetical protein